MARQNIPALQDVQYFRGDTNACPFSRTVDNVAIDITGFSFLLTVSRLNSPLSGEAVANQIMQLTGVVDPDQVANTGLFRFTPVVADYNSIVDADYVNTNGVLVAQFHYDIQETNAGGNIETLGKGSFEVLMDITK